MNAIGPDRPAGPPVCVVVASHPRSGTHLTIDFIRRNFRGFDPRVAPWSNSKFLYFELDELLFRTVTGRHMKRFPRRRKFIAKTHHLFADEVCAKAASLLPSHRLIFLYPFRRISSTLRSLAEFAGASGPMASFPDRREVYFGRDLTVAACLRLHAENWLASPARFLNVDDLLRDPDTAALRLGEVLGEPPVPIDRRLPRPRRFGGGAVGELAERLSRRESTLVPVARRIDWESAAAAAEIDGRFSDLFARLAARQIN